MRIHIYSYSFAPSIGGMERLMELLAREFVRLGHSVIVVTETGGHADMPFEVVRAPNFSRSWRIARGSDAILAAPLSLRRLPSHLLAGRRIVVAHPILYPPIHQGIVVRLKRLAENLVTGVVPSKFMAGHFPGSKVIGNPYDAEVFRRPAADMTRAGVLFVGRLIAEKGCELLLRAFCLAKTSDRLTIVGDGPEKSALKELAKQLGIADRTEFLGELVGPDLASAMQSHCVMVVPTTCEEAFGIVALEGLACGCQMIVAESGGLPEAVGPHALTFATGDIEGLKDRIEIALCSADTQPRQSQVDVHLEQFTPARVARQYLEVLKPR